MTVNKPLVRKDTGKPVILRAAQPSEGTTVLDDGYRIVLKCNLEKKTNIGRSAQTSKRL